MQQHSGQHILSAAFVKEAGAQTTSFHLGASISTIDLDKPDLSEEAIARAERSANEAVRRGLSIASRFVDARETSSLDLRKAPPAAESLRIVEVEGFDRQACCGTHPRTTAEVGPIVRGSSRGPASSSCAERERSATTGPPWAAFAHSLRSSRAPRRISCRPPRSGRKIGRRWERSWTGFAASWFSIAPRAG
jgi:hypothetical protein